LDERRLIYSGAPRHPGIEGAAEESTPIDVRLGREDDESGMDTMNASIRVLLRFIRYGPNETTSHVRMRSAIAGKP
jgi:hypothetical protein